MPAQPVSTDPCHTESTGPKARALTRGEYFRLRRLGIGQTQQIVDHIVGRASGTPDRRAGEQNIRLVTRDSDGIGVVLAVKLHDVDHSVVRVETGESDDHTAGAAMCDEPETQAAQDKQATVDALLLLDRMNVHLDHPPYDRTWIWRGLGHRVP